MISVVGVMYIYPLFFRIICEIASPSYRKRGTVERRMPSSVSPRIHPPPLLTGWRGRHQYAILRFLEFFRSRILRIIL